MIFTFILPNEKNYKVIKKILFSLCIIITASFTHSSRAVEYSQKLFAPPIFSVSANRQLANKEILKLEQDERGLIWLGTRRGVFSYDGYNYQKLIASNTDVDLETVYVRSMLADGDFLWIGTMSEGLFRINLRNREARHYIHNSENRDSLGGVQINGIEKDSNGRLWIAHSFGLDRFNPDSEAFAHFSSADNANDRYFNYLLDLKFDKQGSLWLSTAKGVACFNSSTQHFALFSPNNNGDLLKNVIVRRLFTAYDGRLWLATQKQGTYVIDPEKNNVIKLSGTPDRDVALNTAITETDELDGGRRQIWLGGTEGVEIRDALSGELLKVMRGNYLEEYDFRDDTIFTLMKSKSGLIWFGVNNVGLQFYNPKTEAFKYFDRSSPELKKLFSSFIHHVVQLSDSQILVFNQEQPFVVHLDSGAVEPFFKAGVPNNRVYVTGVRDEQGEYWFGGDSGNLLRISANREPLEEIDLPLTKNQGVYVRTLVLGRSVDLWIGTDRGLVKFNRQSLTASAFENTDGSRFISFVRNLYFDSQNRLWVATTAGLGLVEDGENTVKIFSRESATEGTLRDNYINQIFESKRKEIFVYTKSGLYRLTGDSRENKRFEPFAENILQNFEDEELALEMSNGNIWIGNHLIVGAAGDLLDEFSELDGGLKRGRTKGFFPLNERQLLLFSTNWMIVFDNTAKTDWHYQPPLKVTELLVGNQRQNFDFRNNEVILKKNDDQFAVRFSSLDYSAPERNQYRYKLSGYDKNWISTPADIRQAKYTALPAGQYELLLQGSNRNGQWADAPLKIKVTIQPKLYQTLWFQTIVSLIIALLIFTLFRWRLSVARKKQQEIFEKKEALQKAAMMSELMAQKNRLLAEVTHDLRTPLAMVKVQLEAMQDGVLQADEKTYESLQNRITNLNHMIGDLYQLSLVESGALILNKQPLMLNQLVEEIVESFKPMLAQKHLSVDWVDQTDQDVEIIADKGRLAQVINNLLKNCNRYTDDNGLVRVSLETGDSVVVLRIEDSAPAVAENELDKIFARLYRAESTRQKSLSGSGLGLWICKSIIQAHDGQITASSSALGGLCITINLPL